MPPATPALVVDVGALDANIAAMQALANARGVALRPHAKGHRAPWVAERQLRAGTIGIAVATLAEAARFLTAGVGDVLLTTIVAPQRARDVAELGRHGALTAVVHATGLVADLDVAADAHGITLRVLVDVDVGQRRGGAAPGEAAAAVADAVRAAPNLRLRGVQGYDGHLQGIRDGEERAVGHVLAMERLDVALDALEAAGHVLEVVTTAGTATAPLAAGYPRVTEIQPGSYALMDHRYAECEGVDYVQAAHVVTTVTAVLAPDEVIVDAGVRAVSTEQGPPRVAGLDAAWESAGDEHGRIRGDVAHLRAGDTLALVPSHTDTTVVLHGALQRDA
jgi:D-serine deaminase-like pyridoxal phosphate-dependent protein